MALCLNLFYRCLSQLNQSDILLSSLKVTAVSLWLGSSHLATSFPFTLAASHVCTPKRSSVPVLPSLFICIRAPSFFLAASSMMLLRVPAFLALMLGMALAHNHSVKLVGEADEVPHQCLDKAHKARSYTKCAWDEPQPATCDQQCCLYAACRRYYESNATMRSNCYTLARTTVATSQPPPTNNDKSTIARSASVMSSSMTSYTWGRVAFIATGSSPFCGSWQDKLQNTDYGLYFWDRRQQ